MSTEIVKRSPYAVTEIAEADVYDLLEAGQSARFKAELIKIVQGEVADITIHTVGTMSQLLVGATNVQRQLTDSGYRNQIYSENVDKALQVTDQNLLMLMNAGHQEVIKEAISRIR